MPKFIEVSDEYLANLSKDYSALYKPYLEAGKGSLVPDDGESSAAIKRQLAKVAKDLGYELKFLKDKATPNTVIYKVLSHSFTRTLEVHLASGGETISPHVDNLSEDTVEEPDVTPISEQDTGGGLDEGAQRLADELLEMSDELGLNKASEAFAEAMLAPPKVDPEFEKVWAAGEEPKLPAFSPPLETPEPVKIRARRRTKAEMEAAKAKQNDSTLDAVVEDQEPELEPKFSTTITVIEPVATGTVFEGIATEEHPLVAREKKSGQTPTLYCPSCKMKYVSTRLCVACATPTVPIEDADAILATV